MRVAIVGSGIAGLGCARLLQQQGCRVTVFEANAYAGGHTHTVDVTLEGITAPVDTGFLVYNDRTYPKLIALFAELGIETAPSTMSFAVRDDSPQLLAVINTILKAVPTGERENIARRWSAGSDILLTDHKLQLTAREERWRRIAHAVRSEARQPLQELTVDLTEVTLRVDVVPEEFTVDGLLNALESTASI